MTAKGRGYVHLRDREASRAIRMARVPARLAIVAALFQAVAALPLLAQGDWFPAAEREAFKRNIASKLAAIDTEERLSPERELQAAGVAVDGVSAKLESLSRDAVIRLKPTFPGMEPPSSGNAALDAIAAFQLCSLPMNAIYADASPREHRYDERAWALFSAASVYIASSYLRPAYLAAGVSNQEAQAFLHSEAMNALKTRIGKSTQLLGKTKESCAELILTLMR